MAQIKTSRPPSLPKNTGDQHTAIEFNEINSVVNDNADDINTEVGLVEAQVTTISDGVIAIEGASTPIQSYIVHELPEFANTGALAFNSSIGELVYFKNGIWNRVSDNSEIVIVSGFGFVIDTRNTQDPDGKFFPSASNQFIMPFTVDGSYDCTIEWDCNNPGTDLQTFNTVSGGDTAGPITHTYATEGEYLISISGVIEGFQFFTGSGSDVYDSLKLIDIQNFGTLAFPGSGSNSTTDPNRSFMRCQNMTISAINAPNTAGATDFLWMWYQNYNVTNMPLLDVSSGNRFWAMFRDCTSIQGLPNFNFNNTISGGTKFTEMFYGCTSLTTLDNVDFGDMNASVLSLFRDCVNLTNIPPSCNFSNTENFAYFMQGTTMTEFPNHTQLGSGINFTDAWKDGALTATAIANILTGLVANGRTQAQIHHGNNTKTATLGDPNAGTSFASGTNAAESTWSVQAQTDVATLRSRGWIVTTNP